MGVIILPSRSLDKPPLGVQINWGHPLAKDLVRAYVINEDAGNVVHDLSRQNDGTLAGASFGLNDAGRALLFNGSSTYASFSDFTLGDFSVFIMVKPKGNEGHQATFFCADNYSASPRYAIMIKDYTDSATFYSFVVINDTSGTWISSYTALQNYKLSLVRQGTLVRSYINLIRQTDITVASNDMTFYNPRLGCHYYSGSNREFSAADLNLVIIWGRPLTVEEVYQLNVEPYCFLQPIIRRFYSIPEEVVPFRNYYPNILAH
jgi:hypothetical protein